MRRKGWETCEIPLCQTPVASAKHVFLPQSRLFLLGKRWCIGGGEVPLNCHENRDVEDP